MPLSTDFFLFFTLFYIEAIFSFFGQSFHTIFKGRLISGRRKKKRKSFTNYSIPPPSILTFVVRKVALQIKKLCSLPVCALAKATIMCKRYRRAPASLCHTASNTNSQLIVKRTHFSIIQHDQHTKHIRTLRTVPMKLTGNKTEPQHAVENANFYPAICAHTLASLQNTFTFLRVFCSPYSRFGFFFSHKFFV